MGNLFSIFDPAALSGLPMNWSSALMGLMIIPSPFWLSKSQALLGLKKVTLYLQSEFSSILGTLATPGILWNVVSFLLFILLNNTLGLFPYVFTASSHLLFTLPLGLVLWTGFTLTYAVKQPQVMLAHFVPLGTPYPLMPFMVLIEIVSNIIRPVTLSVRLAANMVAGHLLLTLLSSLAPASSSGILLLVSGSLLLLLVLESAVAMIQAYVFSVLTSLYVEEVEAFEMNLSLLSYSPLY